jgi:hypothetical protein
MQEEGKLTRPCDACGHFIGGGYKRCPKCNIYLCMMCRITLTKISNKFPAKCPMCGGELE